MGNFDERECRFRVEIDLEMIQKMEVNRIDVARKMRDDECLDLKMYG